LSDLSVRIGRPSPPETLKLRQNHPKGGVVRVRWRIN
jgi:hypothetical protein